MHRAADRDRQQPVKARDVARTCRPPMEGIGARSGGYARTERHGELQRDSGGPTLTIPYSRRAVSLS
jgi:hypothetical protein